MKTPQAPVCPTRDIKNMQPTVFTKEDLSQIADRGMRIEAIEAQIGNFLRGFPFLQVVRAASAGDGIRVLAPDELDRAAACYERTVGERRVVKFVPASGAATRMFKELYEFVDHGVRSEGVAFLLAHIRDIGFWPELEAVLPAGADERTVAEYIVRKGLSYGSKPKGLVTFHLYPEGGRKAVEEHLVEGALYAASRGVVRIHFTVSPEHRAAFEALLAERVPACERRYGVRYEIGFSVQDPSTDTIAVNPDNTPFRTDDGRLLFRPAGHGALLANLAKIDADLVFIKNIDNVTTDDRKGDTILYKKALGGMLLRLQEEIFARLRALDAGEADLARIAAFIERELCTKLPEEWDAVLLRALLDRPLRVCGMVRNEGEPGGGPFWVAAPDGTQSLQIAESSQIAPADKHLLRRATHFNPVDLVCGLRSYRGEPFDLGRFSDPSTGFISEKSSGGRPLRAQELPGLWNGAMARWNTIFVEVPVSTFTPVKEVNDLLRCSHRPGCPCD